MTNLAEHFPHPNYKVALAQEDDKPELMNLINHAFSYQDEAKGDKRITLENLSKKIDETEFYVWKNNQVVACCYIEVLEREVHFGLLTVADELRGGDFAPSIIKAIEEYARSKHKEDIKLDYMSLSPWLKSYYEKYGFQETGNVRDLGWCKLIEMSKSLSD